ncbi:unnamed protein product [Acanthoscelides obtectus]|uniref:Shavenoid isoform B-like N-terminal domain-containing protein n=1 Tax=Acanthoscelides obtectus TaxID=200917 RepID=A0A9P0LYC5_ACAOB|nr:unnamed protein product [Acanthoscelides obtectus]CAK1665286.1 hypothetical protein AOBTE_LOCUS24742 [Acanthoscelides obtectus]
MAAFWTLIIMTVTSSIAAAVFTPLPDRAASPPPLAAPLNTAPAPGRNLTFHVTRNNRGDTFARISPTASGMACGEEICVGLSSGTATYMTTAGSGERGASISSLSSRNDADGACWCQCHPHLPVFREDLRICVDDILGTS